jgi:ABC-type Co2+ transport system permease subunit
MHIEPGLVDAAKITLSYATGVAAVTYAAKEVVKGLKRDPKAIAFLVQAVLATALVFVSFEVLPHHPVGVSEVHLIMGTTLLLLFGAGPAAIGLALGLLVQGLFFAPFDLPQYGMNVTTLLVPLFAMAAIAKRIIPANTAYKDVGYGQVLKLSLAYQGGIVAWVAFWAIYGQGVGAQNLSSIASFGVAYMSVVLLEPLVDLAVLAGAKYFSSLEGTGLFHNRLYRA